MLEAGACPYADCSRLNFFMRIAEKQYVMYAVLKVYVCFHGTKIIIFPSSDFCLPTSKKFLPLPYETRYRIGYQ